MKLVVSSIEKKRLFLDFTQETTLSFVEEAAKYERVKETEEESKVEKENVSNVVNNEVFDKVKQDPYADDAAAWAAYYGVEEEEDDYDEDREIEDALGLGSY